MCCHCAAGVLQWPMSMDCRPGLLEALCHKALSRPCGIAFPTTQACNLLTLAIAARQWRSARGDRCARVFFTTATLTSMLVFLLAKAAPALYAKVCSRTGVLRRILWLAVDVAPGAATSHCSAGRSAPLSAHQGSAPPAPHCPGVR